MTPLEALDRLDEAEVLMLRIAHLGIDPAIADRVYAVFTNRILEIRNSVTFTGSSSRCGTVVKMD